MRVDGYDWAGGREAMLRFGPDTGPILVVAMPLLEEWNRTRAFTVALLRQLADRGIGSVLPDLPGHGESAVPIGKLTILQLAEALEALTDQLLANERVPLGLGIRSGALIDYCSLLHGRWYLSPMTGRELLAELHRTWLAAGHGEKQASLDTMMYGRDGPVTIAGQAFSSDFLSSLVCAEPFDQSGIPHRTVRLSTDRRLADRHVDGTPLWRRSEPGNDAALVDLLAGDIAAWVKTCVA